MSVNNKFAAILGFMGQTRDRFQVFGPLFTLEEKIQRSTQVEDLMALEVVYPGEFADVTTTKQLVEDAGLVFSSVNVNIKSEPIFHMGLLTSPDKAVREQAIQHLKIGMDIAAEVN